MNASAIFAGVIFGSIGVGVFIYGKRRNEAKPMIIGFALIVFSYVVPGAILPWVVGALLIAALFGFRG